MSRVQAPQGFSMGPLGRGTKWMLIILLVVSLVSSVSERSLGLGRSQLIFSVSQFVHGEIWRAFTYPFVETSVFGLAIGLLVLWFIGQWFEQRYGTRDFVRFFLLSSVGAAFLAVPFSILTNLLMPFRDPGVAQGPNAAIDAMLVAFALTIPNSNILFGFVLPIRARTIIYFVLGFQIVAGILEGAAALSVTLGGITMGYLLVTGNWRPRRLWALFQRYVLRRKYQRKGLYVVPPKKDKTLN